MAEIPFFSRDLSWLEFNRRVLFQAKDPRVPLLERVRFLAIFSSNLDEFFMKRVGLLKRIVDRGVGRLNPGDFEPEKILFQSQEDIKQLLIERDLLYRNEIQPQLRDAGIHLLNWKELLPEEREQAAHIFKTKIYPVLTPLAVDPAHPFPFLSNLSVSLGVKLREPKSTEHRFARIKIPTVLNQWFRLNQGFVRLTDIIQNHLSELFPEMIIEAVTPFRVTRNADIEQVIEEQEDLVGMVEEELRLRRIAEVVRVEHLHGSDSWIQSLLQNELDLAPEDFYETSGELNYQTLIEIAQANYPNLKFSSFFPDAIGSPFVEEPAEVFQLLKERDVLVHHPFESFQGSVERFIRAAVEDPQVLAIKMTLYRIGDDSPFIPLLIRAAEKGKQAVCVVEVKARFDEERNIYWGEMLEKAGVHVMYGVVGLKTHAKLALVVRKEADEFRFYSHIGTGNYNLVTSRLYTDFGIFTSDAKLNLELVELFNYLTGLSLKRNYKRFLVSPINMRARFVEMINKEKETALAGREAHIVAKMNSLEDAETCALLYEASKAGVKIDLIVRGLCVLVPGVPGISENINVLSCVGRFLEHSRVFYFRSGAKNPVDGKFFLGSADWMSRNFNNRVEMIVPVEARHCRKEIWEVLQMYLGDQVQKWELHSNGKYTLCDPYGALSLGVQDLLMHRTRGTPPRTLVSVPTGISN